MATFGNQIYTDPLWKIRIERAQESLHRQTEKEHEFYWSHGKTLSEARNYGAASVHGDKIVFLDADDWLSDDFIEKIVEPENVLQPLTAHFIGGYQMDPPHYLEPRADLLDGNHLIVGCPVDRELFLDVGGFDDWPIYEDWALWLKIRKAGGTFGKTTGVYNIDVRQDGRNSGPVFNVYDEIRKKYS